MINENYTNTKLIKILTEKQLNIPGLHLFGHRIRKEASEELPPHEHKNNFEIVFVVSGNVLFSIGSENYELNGGDVFVTLPHEIHNTGYKPFSLSEIYWFQIDLDSSVNPLYLDKSTAAILKNALNSLPSRCIKTEFHLMKKLIENSFNCVYCDTSPILSAQFMTLFLFLITKSDSFLNTSVSSDILSATKYIKENIKNKISLEEIAKYCFLSTSQFKQKFKRMIGVSPRQYINNLKINEAKKLLELGHSISSVAQELNFDNTSYFINVFKRYTSYTPGCYKHSIK